MSWNPLKRLYGNFVVARNLPRQKEIPYMPVEELHELRDTRLRKIVQHAAETVPYYQQFFKESKINPNEFQTVEDLDRLPLIDKDTIRTSPHSFVSSSRKGRNAIHFVTSGTTGKPLDVYHDIHSMITNIAFGEREKEVAKKFLAGSDLKELFFSYSTSTIKKVWKVYREWTFLPLDKNRISLSVLEPFDDLVKEVNQFKPAKILGYGSFLEMFFRTLHLRNIQIHLPKVVLYVADSLTEGGKNLIEKTFGIPVLSIYNCVEDFKLGFFCEERNGFHLHSDLTHVKVVKSNGEIAKPGEKGNVVISNFVNHGTVLLNYRLSDVASLSDKKCPCGRTFPLLSELDGRAEDIVFLPNQEFVHPRAIWNIFKSKNDIVQYQLIQHELQRFELKLVTLERESYDAMVESIVNDLKSLLGRTAIIEPTFCVELQKEGKFRPVISHCKPAEFI